MRGEDEKQSAMFSYVPQDHPWRAIRGMVDRALERIDADLDKLYAGMGRSVSGSPENGLAGQNKNRNPASEQAPVTEKSPRPVPRPGKEEFFRSLFSRTQNNAITAALKRCATQNQAQRRVFPQPVKLLPRGAAFGIARPMP